MTDSRHIAIDRGLIEQDTTSTQPPRGRAFQLSDKRYRIGVLRTYPTSSRWLNEARALRASLVACAFFLDPLPTLTLLPLLNLNPLPLNASQFILVRAFFHIFLFHSRLRFLLSSFFFHSRSFFLLFFFKRHAIRKNLISDGNHDSVKHGVACCRSTLENQNNRRNREREND